MPCPKAHGTGATTAIAVLANRTITAALTPGIEDFMRLVPARGGVVALAKTSRASRNGLRAPQVAKHSKWYASVIALGIVYGTNVINSVAVQGCAPANARRGRATSKPSGHARESGAWAAG